MTPFPYQSADYEEVPCNLCGGCEVEILRERDRNGLKVRTCICKGCGLIYINPRMTSAWYERYYQREYRAQMARFKGKPLAAPNYEEMFESSTRHGRALANRFKDYWENGIALEAGSSVGGVLNGLRETLGVAVLGIEPSSPESEQANQRGIKTYNCSIERVNEEIPPVGNIVCTQSLNHFLDPRYFLLWANRRLRGGGKLFLEVMNFRHVFRHFEWMPRAIQIDHTYMFVPEVLSRFVELAGFDILATESDEGKNDSELKKLKRSGLPGFHIGIVAKKTEREPFQHGTVENQFKTVRESLEQITDSAVRYFFRFGLKKLLKTGKI